MKKFITKFIKLQKEDLSRDAIKYMKDFLKDNQDINESRLTFLLKRRIREEVKKLPKPKGKCRLCGKSGNLTKHHTNIIRKPFHFRKLCEECHKKLHAQRGMKNGHW